jgi:hypothetical protein
MIMKYNIFNVVMHGLSIDPFFVKRTAISSYIFVLLLEDPTARYGHLCFC